MSDYQLRSRTFNEYVARGVSQFIEGDHVTEETQDRSQTYCGWQMTRSRGNPWPSAAKGKVPIGGEFDTIRTTYNNSVRGTIFDMRGGPFRYRGEIFPALWLEPLLRTNMNWNEATEEWAWSLGDSVLHARGATAISRSAPTVPQAALPQATIELLRDGLPKIPGAALKERVSMAKKGANEFLNLEFGWKPLVSDIRDACTAIVESERILKQLERDSGRNVRRTYRFEPEISTGEYPGMSPGRPWPNPSPWLWVAGEPVAHIRGAKVQRDVWFKGCFTYYYEPVRMNWIEEVAAKARLLLGIRLTPDILWETAPWSWLADWAVNIGPVLANVSNFQSDGLTLRYGYVMERTYILRSETFFGRANGGADSNGNVAAQCKATTIRKRRLEAEPYSLGLIGTGLTLRQTAILSALGITRGKHNN